MNSSERQLVIFLTDLILGQIHTRYALNFAFFSHKFLEFLFNLQLISVDLQTVLVDLQTFLVDLQIIFFFIAFDLYLYNIPQFCCLNTLTCEMDLT